VKSWFRAWEVEYLGPLEKDLRFLLSDTGQLVDAILRALNDLHDLAGKVPKEESKDENAGCAGSLPAKARILTNPSEIDTDHKELVAIDGGECEFSGFVLHEGDARKSVSPLACHLRDRRFFRVLCR